MADRDLIMLAELVEEAEALLLPVVDELPDALRRAEPEQRDELRDAHDNLARAWAHVRIALTGLSLVLYTAPPEVDGEAAAWRDAEAGP